MKNTLSPCRFLVSCFGMVLAFISVGCKPDSRPVLHIYNWSDYVDMELVKEFEKKYDCKVSVDNFGSNEEMYAKIKASNEPFDLIVPSTYMVEMMAREGMIQKLDPEKIPNAMKYTDPVVTKKLRDEKMEYSVPYLLGFTGIGYNVQKVGEEPTSWTIFGDEKFKGRMAMLDDMRETIGVGLLCLGYSANTRDAAQLAEARDLLIKWRPNLSKFGVDDIKSGLESGEYYVVHQYSGDILQYTLKDRNIRFAMPKEGALFAADHFVIPKNAQNADLAHKFIDFLCDPANSARNMEDTQFLAPIPEAVKLLSEELRETPGFIVSHETLENAQVIEDVGDDLQKYSEVWDEIKSAK